MESIREVPWSKTLGVGLSLSEAPGGPAGTPGLPPRVEGCGPGGARGTVASRRGHLKVEARGLPPAARLLLHAPRWEAADSGRLPALLAAGSGRCNVQPDM